MSFDFSSINDTKYKPLVQTAHEARFELAYENFLNEIEKNGIFRQYTTYKYKINPVKRTISITLSLESSVFIEPRYIFKFIEVGNSIKINIFARADKSNRNVYLPAAIIRLIKYSSFDFMYFFVIDQDNQIIQHECTMTVMNIATFEANDEFLYYFYRASKKRLEKFDEESVITEDVASKLPIFRNITICVVNRNAIFDGLRAFNKFVKKLYTLAELRGYNADNIYKAGYKRDVTNKFITVYNFTTGLSKSVAFNNL